MASHYRLLQFVIWNNIAISSTNSYTSAVVEVLNLDNIALQLNATGTPNGSFAVQVSVDYQQDQQGNVVNAGHWVPITGIAPTLAGSATQIYIDLNELSAPWLRVMYTNTSSSGNLSGYVSGKGLM